MKHAALPAAALVAMALLAPAAHAQSGLYSQVTLTSDYRYQGVSSSQNRPVVQGVLHHFRPDGWYAGVFATEVDYGYAQSPSYELDVYGGKTLKLDGKTDLKLQALASVFPDDRTPGPTLNFVQGGVSLIRREGPLTLTGLATYVPEGSYGAGQVWRVEGGADYALGRGVTLKALAGHQASGRRPDRTYWSFGAELRWKHLIFGTTYQDTDLTPRECGFTPKICRPAVTGAVTAVLPLILFPERRR
ncbi:TorF family putative porin [Phenylobacterium sp.]|uniref:TorF family putative porin n=1 Tax=Phenylobacterium sp. TaxID=1871053 RepID=UPI0025F0E5CC|nr:TorF family putative porin [Phenylobacterium sp.]MBX3481938.1 TorF family putative porin [Phenylobacterium sp.]